MKTFGILSSVLLLAVILGCNKDKTPTDQSNDDYLKKQLVGTWDREWEYGPAVYERVLNSDGTMAYREYKALAAAPAKGAPIRLHRSFNVEVPLAQEYSGTWSVQGGQITYQLKLADGQPMTMAYKVGKISATEFVESSAGVESKSDARYVRYQPKAASAPSATTRRR